MLIAFEIIGIPTYKPLVGDFYQLALIFERTTIDDIQPIVDGVWVTWAIGNGPRAVVTATDTYSNKGKGGADLEERDPISNNWHVEDWTDVEPYTCQKLESEGCDVLTAKIYKYWHEYNSIEDISLQNGTYLISLYTRKCASETFDDCEGAEQYNKESAWFFDISETASALKLGQGLLTLVASALVIMNM